MTSPRHSRYHFSPRIISRKVRTLPPEDPDDIRRFGYSRDKRSDCVQVVIALIVTPDGFPIAYEVLSGNTTDKTTLADFLKKIETQYGKADRIWIMDRGIPTDGREIVLTRYTQPEKDLQILLHQLQLTLPEQAPPKIQAPVPTSN